MREDVGGYTVMQDYKFVVNVHAATFEQAHKVMTERIDHTEDYGFPYSIKWDGLRGVDNGAAK